MTPFVLILALLTQLSLAPRNAALRIAVTGDTGKGADAVAEGIRRVHAPDLYIAGHDHHLELLRGRMLHLISGAGSSPIPPVKLRTSTIFPPEIRRERIGFAVVEIDARAIRVRFYDAKGRARSEWINARTR